MMRAVIIDDEALMRRTIERLVHEHCPRIKPVIQADNCNVISSRKRELLLEMLDRISNNI
jgi:chemotaxis response regulator CheB